MSNNENTIYEEAKREAEEEMTLGKILKETEGKKLNQRTTFGTYSHLSKGPNDWKEHLDTDHALDTKDGRINQRVINRLPVYALYISKLGEVAELMKDLENAFRRK